jgi:hypothetical protein
VKLVWCAVLVVHAALIPAGVRGNDDEVQPGTIRLQLADPQERVSINSEDVPSIGLQRSRYQLMLVPGSYRITFRMNGNTCSRRVLLKEDEKVSVPSCSLLQQQAQTSVSR